jgi:integrase
MALKAGVDIKTLQYNLGHYTASFTLDVYGHCTDDMRTESSRKIEKLIINTLPTVITSL